MIRRGPRPRCAVLFAVLASARTLVSGHARAAIVEAAPVPPPGEPDRREDADADADSIVENSGFVLPAGVEAAPALSLMGYVDVGFVNAGGDGTSFAPGDNRVPADYGVDTFAPAVNSRGDVASIDAGGRATNGFLPRSVNIAGRPSFLINTVNQDLRYQAPHLMAFVRVQVLPRWGGDGAGNQTTLFVEQAFGRVTPIEGRELFVAAGKFDSVFGIEYLDNPAIYRTGITPSLLARYTTGTALGLKAFYRLQLARLWSAVSLNVAATNGANFVEALQPPDASLTGLPILSGRFGYELNLPRVQVKLGASGQRGPRNDQFEREAMLTMFGFDARLYVAGVSLAGEYVHVDEDEGAGGKQTGAGGFPIASAFYARGFWAQAAYGLALRAGPLRTVTPYGRYERRHAWFEGFRPITVARVTVGLRIDLWASLVLKGEVLINQEIAGAPTVDNNVFTTSAVWSW